MDSMLIKEKIKIYQEQNKQNCDYKKNFPIIELKQNDYKKDFGQISE